VKVSIGEERRGVIGVATGGSARVDDFEVEGVRSRTGGSEFLRQSPEMHTSRRRRRAGIRVEGLVP
jgi:hypothetical protein